MPDITSSEICKQSQSLLSTIENTYKFSEQTKENVLQNVIKLVGPDFTEVSPIPEGEPNIKERDKGILDQINNLTVKIEKNLTTINKALERL